MTIKLIVGLGNPGNKYASTRHNIGEDVLREIVRYFNGTFSPNSKFLGLTAEITMHSQKILCLIPTTYMNASGAAVSSISKYFNFAPEEILIIHDDMDLPKGDIRLKLSGGHGGHNGLKDIIKGINSKDFYRLRVGIGHPDDRSQVVDYVLNKFSLNEKNTIFAQFDTILEGFNILFTEHLDRALQFFNTRKGI